MYVTLFNVAGLAIVAWLLLIFLPKWRVTRFVAETAVFPVFLAVIYAVGVVPLLMETGLGVMRDFGTAEGVTRLLARQDVALVAWIHILAFDQLVALFIYRENMERRYVPLPAQSVLLFLTLMFGPVGFLSYYLLRLLRRRRADEATRAQPAKPLQTLDDPARAPQTTSRARRLYALVPESFARERALFWTGLAGVVLGAALLALTAARGRFVGPEGDLYKAGTFDLGVGIYLLTLTLLLPVADLSERGLRRWRWLSVLTAVYGYAVESVQAVRGLNPRFTRAGSPLDQLAGGLFFLVALGIVALFVVLAWRFFRGRTRFDGTPLLLAVRYACAATFLAFAAGLWMSAAQGSRVGAAGNLLPLHAAGFHGLQAVPLVALLFGRSGAWALTARRWVHAAGLAWLAACLGIAWQTAAGRSVLEPSAATLCAALALGAWVVCVLRAMLAWRRRGGARTEQSPRPHGLQPAA